MNEKEKNSENVNALQKAKQDTVSFKDTLNLPRTEFPIRSNPKIDDTAMLERWEKDEIYKKSFEVNSGQEKYILHDGPPYANGHIHLGHAYNKILKDIVCKSQRMFGKHVPVTPGWDCHGLPIEQKVTQEKKGLDRIELKKACREYANGWINTQKEEFKKLGVLMDWQHPYITMNPTYESSILKAFGIFVDRGFIERKNKTVPWCATDQTVLATAEIEYEDRKDPSIYVLFPLTPEAINKIDPKLSDKVVNLLIWTTTPWTLPLNRAVSLKSNTHYEILQNNDVYYIVAKALSDKICATMGIEKKVIFEFSSEKLEGQKALHPFILGLTVPILVEPSVLLDEGTACVHRAPGCGPEDYEIGIRNNLEIFSPISPDGKYTKGIEPKELEGMSVADGQGWVINTLSVHNKLFYKTSIRHSYPHCWRCKNGLIFRATKQWFCDLSRENLKEKAIAAIDNIKMIPETGAERLKSTLEGRLEWCLSRQRIWGVPIPAVLCTNCDDYSYTDKNLIDKVAQGVSTEGIEYWDKVELNQLLPKDFTCPKCKKSDFKKETDILDVWFDSGVSHFAVLYKNSKLQFPANIYLEGSDQHRGWFQSSLLTSLVLEQQACTKSIVTHGFTVDANGKKMSKSLGNVVSPQEMVDKMGTDGLRLWVSSIDVKDEAVVSEVLIKNVQEVNRKIRNTCRFLLSNLYDFDFEKDAVKVAELTWIDKYALSQLYVLSEKIKQNYLDCRFTAVFHELADYCAKDLSAFYLDIIKDRLYVEQADGKLRRSAQTVCWYILDTLTKLMAPILSFSSEQISDFYQKNKKDSIHLQKFANISSEYDFFMSDVTSQSFYKKYILTEKPDRKQDNYGGLIYWNQLWNTLINIRGAILKAIEEQREKGIIKHPLEAHVSINIDLNKKELSDIQTFFEDIIKSGTTLETFFKEFLVVSKFSILSTPATLKPSEYKGLYIDVSRVEGDKCPRCWNYDITKDSNKLCNRCQKIIK